MGEAIAFYTLATLVLAFAVMVVSTKDTVHSVLFLVLDFLFVAALYVLLGRRVPRRDSDPGVRRRHRRSVSVRRHAGEFEAAARGVPRSARQTKLGFGLAAAILIELGAMTVYGYVRPAALPAAASAIPADIVGNTEQVGWMLYTSYLIPFEIASMLLLVAMIGAIMLAKREL